MIVHETAYGDSTCVEGSAPPVRQFFFTFGCGQPHEGCYHVVTAPDAARARELMFQRFGNRWSMMYLSAEEAGVEEFHLKEIK